MTDREKLVELITEAGIKYATIEGLADHLIAHGVNLKQMQKPLTVEEVRALQEFAWLEWRNDNRIAPMVPSGIERDTATNVEYFTFWDDGYAVMSNYGKTWRCWADRPTEEERKAAEWEK